MKNNKSPRGKCFKLRVSAEELQKIKAFSKATTCRSASAYARQLLLHKPVTVLYRNRSADDLLTVLTGLKNELNAVGTNFNQAVHRLHTLDRIPEIRSWLVHSQGLLQSFMEKSEEIRLRMIEIYGQWSQK